MPTNPGEQAGFLLRRIGIVESPLIRREEAPRQGDEGAPDSWIVLDPDIRAAARDLAAGSDVLVLTWLHLADRDVLAVHPRSDASRPITGVFSTRSPDRPNPIGLHRVTIMSIDDLRLRVSQLEALDGTPVIDIKPVLGTTSER
jgi:tRNA-Thr(GGU) m(6)t(6)A37 methyltransferase TsaA